MSVQEVLQVMAAHRRRINDLEGIEIPFQAQVPTGGGGTGVRDEIEEILPVGLNSFDFLNIPQVYKHLEVRYLARSDRVASFETLNVRINGLLTAGAHEHTRHQYTATADHIFFGTSSTRVDFAEVPSSLADADEFGNGVVDFPYYKTTRFKGLLSYGGHWKDGVGLENHGSRDTGGRGESTVAITKLTFFLFAGDFVSPSKFILYGIDAA